MPSLESRRDRAAALSADHRANHCGWSGKALRRLYSRSTKSADSMSDDAYAQLAEAFDPADQEVAGHDCSDARRRAGEDQVAGQQFVILRQEMQHVRHVPDHVGKIALLPHRARS